MRTVLSIFDPAFCAKTSPSFFISLPRPGSSDFTAEETRDASSKEVRVSDGRRRW